MNFEYKVYFSIRKPIYIKVEASIKDSVRIGMDGYIGNSVVNSIRFSTFAAIHHRIRGFDWYLIGSSIKSKLMEYEFER